MVPGQLSEEEVSLMIAHDTGKQALSDDALKILDLRIQACARVTRGLGLRTDYHYGSDENLTTQRKRGWKQPY